MVGRGMALKFNKQALQKERSNWHKFVNLQVRNYNGSCGEYSREFS